MSGHHGFTSQFKTAGRPTVLVGSSLQTLVFRSCLVAGHFIIVPSNLVSSLCVVTDDAQQVSSLLDLDEGFMVNDVSADFFVVGGKRFCHKNVVGNVKGRVHTKL